MSKLCLIYNTAPHYRTAIFTAIDKKYDCVWWFGKTKNDIREMDVSKLKHTNYYKTYGNPSKVYWQGSMIRLLFRRDLKNYFILTETRSLSVWMMILLKSIFFHHKRIYGWSHGWYGREGRLRKSLDRWRIRNMSGQFVYNERARQLMIAGGIPKEKVFVIANSLDYDNQKTLRQTMATSDIYTTHFGNSIPTIVFIGRLIPAKKLDILIDALSINLQKGKRYNLVLIGDGVERTPLQGKVKEKGLQGNVWFYGACYDEAENAKLIYNADLCVSPGNVGLTAIHTMMFGTPVITSNDFIHQGPEFEAIQPGLTGDFFEAHNVDSLANAISNWFDNHIDRESIRQACFCEIDSKWNPHYQMDVLNQHLKLT